MNEKFEDQKKFIGEARVAFSIQNKELEKYKKMVEELNERVDEQVKLAESLGAAEKKAVRRRVSKKKAVKELTEFEKRKLEMDERQYQLSLDQLEANLRFKDGLMEVKRQMMDVTNVTKGMNQTWFQSASTSKVWTAASRLLSGTGLWSIQNAVRGVIDVFAIYQTAQEKQMEANNKAAKAMENFSDTYEDYLKKAQPVRNMVDEMNTALSALEADPNNQVLIDELDLVARKLELENMSFKLAKKRGLTDAQALATLENELDAMDELIQTQNRNIFGSKFKKDMMKNFIAPLELSVLKFGKDMRDRFFGKPGEQAIGT